MGRRGGDKREGEKKQMKWQDRNEGTAGRETETSIPAYLYQLKNSTAELLR